MGDLIDRRFGSLTVVEQVQSRKSPCGTTRKMWRCLCDCGNEVIASTSNLINGNTKSCGCWKAMRLVKHNTRHGGANDRLYGIWKNMKRRCNSPNDSHYKDYGGKGIKVCDEWNDYARFKEWAYANGYDDNAKVGDCTIDRIDNNMGYEPSNCRWVDRTIQANNTSRNRYVEFQGKRLTIAEFSRAMNIGKNHALYYVNKFDKEVKNGSFDFTTSGDRGGTQDHIWVLRHR